MRCIDYQKLLSTSNATCLSDAEQFLADELPWIWRDAYVDACARPTDIVRIQKGTFVYLYDDYATLEKKGIVPFNPRAEARVVGVYGRSAPPPTAGRKDSRLRGWIGPTEMMFGKEWDKGHFIAHSLGGVVGGFEANVFLQKRELNRGWSADGKVYRSMERYCLLHPATFCFSRPIYSDESSRPSHIEFGVLRSESDLWSNCFDNS